MTKAAKRASKVNKPAATPGTTEIENARARAALAASPYFAAYRVIAAAEGKTANRKLIDISTMLKELGDQVAAVNRGDLAQAEAMLMNQATALQSLFVRLVETGMEQDQLLQYETHMRLALRAQSQCRASLETLAAIKNPPVLFAKQANVTTGPQQINNGMAAPSRAREIESGQSKLSGGGHELLPDTRTSALESQVNQEVEALAEVHRPEVGRG